MLNNYNVSTHILLDKLTNIVKSLNGCIFGEYIREYYI